MKKYGDAYEFDGSVWRYTHNGQRVPNAKVYVDQRTGDVEMEAPELLVHQMIDLPTLAELMGVQRRSIPNMLYQGTVPQPQFRAGKQGALWARPIIDNYLQTRPTRQWAKKVKAQ